MLIIVCIYVLCFLFEFIDSQGDYIDLTIGTTFGKYAVIKKKNVRYFLFREILILFLYMFIISSLFQVALRADLAESYLSIFSIYKIRLFSSQRGLIQPP